MSRLTDELYRTGATSEQSYVTGCGDLAGTATWRAVHHLALRMASGLAERGIGPGDTIAVLTADPAEVAPLLQGAWMRRAAVTMLQQPTARTDLVAWSHDIAKACRTISAGMVVVGESFASAARGLSAVGLDPTAVAAIPAGRDVEPLDGEECDPALLQLTSGSTGSPKAVVVTHEALHANIHATADVFELEPGRDVLVSWLPLFHDMGMVAFLSLPMVLGISAVKVTPGDFMANPKIWPDLLSRHRATMTAAPNFAYGILARTLDRAPVGTYDLSAMRCVINGAEPVDPNTVDSLVESGARHGLRATSILPCYGLAEATLSVSLTRPGDGMRVDRVDPRALDADGVATPSEAQDAKRLPTLGSVVPGVQVRIVDDSGSDVETRCVGDVLISGASVAKSYVTLAGPAPARTDDGWLDTGDRGYFAQDGQLVICGRRKDLIIVGGRNIYPTDVERATEAVDSVRSGSVAAVSVCREQGAEGFAIIAESQAHDDADQCRRIESEVMAKAIESIGAAPMLVWVVPPGRIPKTTSGKLRRRAAAEMVAANFADISAIPGTGAAAIDHAVRSAHAD